jgi:hypothetical protein
MNSGIIFDVLEIVEQDKVVDRLPYLKINTDVARQLSGLLSLPVDKVVYTAQEVDDLLLGHLEILGRYVKDKLISFELARSTFEYHVRKAYENNEIKKYLADTDNKDTYIHLPYLYHRFLSHSKPAAK